MLFLALLIWEKSCLSQKHTEICTYIHILKNRFDKLNENDVLWISIPENNENVPGYSNRRLNQPFKIQGSEINYRSTLQQDCVSSKM